MKDYIGSTIERYFCNDEQFSLITDKGTFYIKACGDCCSKSWFNYDEEKNVLINKYALCMDDIIGEIIVDIKTTDISNLDGYNSDGYDDNNDGYYLYYKIELIMESGIKYGFMMINSSNGFYSGYIMVD